MWAARLLTHSALIGNLDHSIEWNPSSLKEGGEGKPKSKKAFFSLCQQKPCYILMPKEAKKSESFYSLFAHKGNKYRIRSKLNRFLFLAANRKGEKSGRERKIKKSFFSLSLPHTLSLHVHLGKRLKTDTKWIVRRILFQPSIIVWRYQKKLLPLWHWKKLSLQMRRKGFRFLCISFAEEEGFAFSRPFV